MMKASSSLLTAVALTLASLPAFGGPSELKLPENMSDELLRSTAISLAAQSSSSNPFRPSFVTAHAERISPMARFPFGTDLRHVRVPINDYWAFGWTEDQYARSAGFTRQVPDVDLLGVKLHNGVGRIGLVHGNLPNMPNKTMVGGSVSFTW